MIGGIIFIWAIKIKQRLPFHLLYVKLNNTRLLFQMVRWGYLQDGDFKGDKYFLHYI